MRLKIWKLFGLLCASLLLAAIPRAALACGWSEPEVDELTFFAPEIIRQPNALPFFYRPSSSFFVPDRTPADLTALNLREWDEFFQHKLPSKDWSELLYPAALPRLDNLIFALQGKPDHRPGADDAPFMAYTDRAPLIAALYYVGFAKRVEPFAMEGFAEWDWSGERRPVDRTARDKAIATLIEAGSKALAAAKIPFLRQRYALQILRLHFYRPDPAAGVKFYQEHQSDWAGESSVTWRAIGYGAGCLRKANRKADAAGLYAVLFDRFPPMKVSALTSFRPKEEREWRDSLAQASSVRQRTVLWQMVGILTGDPRAIKEIYAIDRKSDLLPLLLVREVNRTEVESRVTQDSPTKERPALISFIESVAKKGDVTDPFLWDLAAGHLRALAGDSAAAKRLLLRAAGRAPQDPVIQRQLRVSRLYATLQGMSKPVPADEPMLARELKWLKQEAERNHSTRLSSFLIWSRERLASLYLKHGDVLLSLCLADENHPLYKDPTQIERLIQFLRKPHKSAFEQFAAASYARNESSLRELQALIALYAGDIPKAAALFEPLKTDALNADPFVIHIRDCHDCDAQDPHHKRYSKTEFVRRLDALLRQAAAEPAKAAELYFEIANGLYNITYYGNSRVMYDNAHFDRTPPTYDCSHAKAYYRKAMEISKDRELAAKAAFMIGKCELNAYITAHPDHLDYAGGAGFAALRDSYPDTRYYKEAIRECGFFAKYLEKSKNGR
jgi:hypothetical protein